MGYILPNLAFAAMLTLVAFVWSVPCCLADEQYEVTGPSIRTDGGEVFMEEVTPEPPRRTAPARPKVPLDMSNLGVKVDPRGKIVPLIQRDGDGPVMPYYSNLQAYDEPWWTLVPPFYVVPGGVVPTYGEVVPTYGYPYPGYPWTYPPINPYTGTIPGVPTFQGPPNPGGNIWGPGVPFFLY